MNFSHVSVIVSGPITHLAKSCPKRWTETAIPAILLVLVFAVLANYVQNFLTIGALAAMSRQAGEIGLIVLGLGLVMIVGGIDLSVGSTFALANFMALLAMNVWGWSAISTALVTLGLGALLGAVNGVLVGYLRLRAFLTTLITLIVYRAAYDMLVLRYSTAISANLPEFRGLELVRLGDHRGRANGCRHLRRGRYLWPIFF